MTLSLFDYAVDFDAPGYLFLLLLLPVVWWTGRRSLAALDRFRRWSALTLRMGLVLVAVLALAEMQIVRTTDRLAVIYLLDRSLSVSPDEARRAIDFINETRAQQRDRSRGDLAGVIVFGREAAVEIPPLADDAPLLHVETVVDNEYTNLAAGLRLARACFPADCAKRLVILSDGNENVESALDEARSFLDGDIGVDVVPLRHPRRGDVLVEKAVMPVEVQANAPFEVRTVVNNVTPDDQPAAGVLRVVRRTGVSETVVAEESVEVKPGRQVYSFRQELEDADFYTYDVQFIAADPESDALPQNNRATAFTHVRGKGRLLLIEDADRPGEFDYLVNRLRAAQIDVETVSSNNAFTNLGDLQRYDSVILANVARTSGDDESLAEFSDEQIAMLVRNTEQLGAGLIMLGGPQSFGAGGWHNTQLEEAMPVDFHVKNPKVVPQGALMLVIDTSGSMAGGKIVMSKAAAVAAVQVLGENDYVGIVGFDSAAYQIAPLQRVGTGAAVIHRISQIGASGGTNMYPGMHDGYQALVGVKAAVKHMIVLTDGQTEGSDFERMTADMRRLGITTSTVAIGADSAAGLMRRIAGAGGGKFYSVINPAAVPRIFMKEAVRVARPLVYENPQGISASVDYPHEMLSGIGATIPPVTGYVLTTAKRNPLVEVAWRANLPSPGTHPLLAAWTYGLGRSVALTTDTGQRWANRWTEWENYDKLFTQMVRWSMRPTTADSRFALAADAQDGTLRVVISALDQEQGYLNFLMPRGAVVGPDQQSIELKIEQTAPGRYVADAPAQAAGNYFISVIPGPDTAPLRMGVNVSYSLEFRQDYDENVTLLTTLATQAPAGGEPGRLIDLSQPLEVVAENNLFRRDLPRPKARQDCWHLLLLSLGCVFFADVFNRRVAWSFNWWGALAARLPRWRGQPVPEVSSEAMARLGHKKQEIAEQWASSQGARWESAATAEDHLTEAMAAPNAAAATVASAPTLTAEAPSGDEDSYTSRLLKAKKKIWEERGSSPRSSEFLTPEERQPDER